MDRAGLWVLSAAVFVVASLWLATPLEAYHRNDVDDDTHVLFGEEFSTFVHQCSRGPETGDYNATLIAYREDQDEAENQTVGATEPVTLWGPKTSCRAFGNQAEITGRYTDQNSPGPGWYNYGYKLVGREEPIDEYDESGGVNGTWYSYNGWKMEVISTNHPPVADFSVDPSVPVEGEPAQFNDTSKDPDNDIVNWTWDFGDGGVSHEQHPQHTFASAAKYTVTLTVEDEEDEQDSKSGSTLVAHAGDSPADPNGDEGTSDNGGDDVGSPPSTPGLGIVVVIAALWAGHYIGWWLRK